MEKISASPSFTSRFAMVMQPDFKPSNGKSLANRFNLNPKYTVANAAICTLTRDDWCSMVLIDDHTYVRFVCPRTLRASLTEALGEREVCI